MLSHHEIAVIVWDRDDKIVDVITVMRDNRTVKGWSPRKAKKHLKALWPDAARFSRKNITYVNEVTG